MSQPVACPTGFRQLAGGLIALALIAIGVDLMAQLTVSLPASLPGENPADFAGGGFHMAHSMVALPLAVTVWDWCLPAITAALLSGACGWWWSAHLHPTTLWAAVKTA